MKERLKWCLLYKDWTLEDWRKVVWTDETAVVGGSVCGKRRIWRRADEAYDNTCVVVRWKGFASFMWWSCFTYDRKGPYYIWPKETKAMKQKCEKDLKDWNAEIFERDYEEWKTALPIAHLSLDRQGKRKGRKPQFNHETYGTAFTLNEGKGGINWYRYQEEILKPRLFLFVQECRENGQPDTIVMEDGAAPHASKHINQFYSLRAIIKMLWPANSPDLNMIEPCWFYMKRETTANGPISGKGKIEEAWIKSWEDLSQTMIQEWIQRIMVHIQEVIALKGGNHYKEGRMKGQKKRRVH